MNYYSLNNRHITSNFENAVLKGIASDKGLYFPDKILPLPASFFDSIDSLSKVEIAYRVIEPFVGGEIPEQDLKEIITTCLDFDFPVVPLRNNISVLELFHGPTLAFKDVGARFMAGCLGYFIKRRKLGKITVLVATSGDTGGAVANGFLGVQGIDVVILYPKGKVSKIQEKQLTTLGQNIRALEVNGSFDDCQQMVKRAFLDEDITNYRTLTSANSINIARWMPQMFYYFLAWKQLQNLPGDLVVSVPSGNFGNICAGFIARELGLPISHFIASNNANDVVARYLSTGLYQPKKSIATLSNAMDVGDPSNFVRIQELFSRKSYPLQEVFSSYSFDDEATRAAIKEVYKENGYIMDPHGAVGYLGLQRYLKDHPEDCGVFLETAHPVKFLDTVEESLKISIPIPQAIDQLAQREKISKEISTYSELKQFLVSEN